MMYGFCRFYFCAAIFISIHGVVQTESPLNRFASKLNKFLYSENSTTAAPTLIWSPQSVYTALSALLDGAGGDTEVELRDLLQQQSFPLETNKNNNKTDVSSTPFRTSSEEQSKSGLNVTTGIFISNEYKLSKGFSEKLLSRQSQKNDRSSNKFGKLDTLPLDFSQAEESAQIVNSWVNQSTGGLIQQIVQPHQFNSNAKLVLANAVQFKGMWKSRFNPSSTETRVFHGLNGDSKVDMMFQRSTQDYAKFFDGDGQSFQMLKLGYVGSETKLVFVLPENVTFLPILFNRLTSSGGSNSSSTKLSELLERLEPTELDISFPKFNIESEVPITSVLKKAGLKSLFSPFTCNLTGMVVEKEAKEGVVVVDNSSSSALPALYLSEMIHKTVLEIDEEGTAAGAVTAAFLVPLSGIMHHKILNFTLNKPFILFIREDHSSVFQGIVSDLPSSIQVGVPPSQNDAVVEGVSSDFLKSLTSIPPNNNASSLIDGSPTMMTSALATNSTQITSNKRDDQDLQQQQEKGWWISEGKPEYLIDEGITLRSKDISSKLRKSSTKSISTDAAAPNDSPNNKGIGYRFQQPEPTSPEGIRFLYPKFGLTSLNNSLTQDEVK